MRRWQLLTLSLTVIIIAVCATGFFLLRHLRHSEEALSTPKEERVDLGSVVTQVRALSRLETASMRVVNVSTIKQSYNWVPNALGGDELTLYAVGDVIAGIDLSQLQPKDVWREPDGTVVMRLPPPQMLVSRIDNRQTRVINRKTGFLRRADQGLEARARQYAEQQIRNEAFHRGILSIAQDNGDAKIAAFVHTLGFGSVKFVHDNALPRL